MYRRASIRAILGLLLAVVLTTGTAFAQDEAPESIKIGYAISKSGPFVGGASVTTLPNYQLWVHDVNERGGILLSEYGVRVPIEVIEYDDRSSSEEAIQAVQRLINQDEVDFILPPWGTGMNLAVAPLLNRAGYPHLAVTSVTDRAPELAQRWNNAFFFLGTSTQGSEALVDMLSAMRERGEVGSKVAMVAASDEFGIELSNAARDSFGAADFELVYDRSYPGGTQDFQSIVGEVARLEPDIFVAFSYPPETLAITDAAMVLDFNPTVYYTAVGTAFPLFVNRFGDAAEGVMGIGGWDANSPLIQEYRDHHIDVIGAAPDRWASPNTYASLQVLEQAIERVGRIDRAAVIEEIATGTFDTVLGEVTLQDGLLTKLWWVGQWQGGEFVALAPIEREGIGEAIVPKPEWPEAE
ncbi:MAG TPA: amino acid ABC transporter substrate-binding protein [Trueperaceae bacterium]|nr:amino acid ABC transporter substrate-binding protein [Trueperaceae bacterium]